MPIRLPTNCLREETSLPGFCMLLLLCLLLASENTEAATAASGYAIVLASAPGENLQWTLQENRQFDGRTVYVERTIIKGEPWERLCLGFFSRRTQAASIIDEIQQSYPGAWLQKTSAKDNISIIRQPVSMTSAMAPPVKTAIPAKAAKSANPAATVSTSTTSLTEKQLDSLLRRAKTDFKNKKYSSSIRYLNALVAAGDHSYAQESLELLGLARQRNGQKNHAVAAYQKYLLLYPDTEGADRVRQRLAGLMTATSGPEEKIRMTTTAEGSAISTHGSLSQFYQSNTATVDDAGKISTLSQMISYFDLTTTHRTTDYDQRYQFTADHVYDFIDSDEQSEFRFIDTYYELSHRKTGSSGRIGRQRLQLAGILRRFDGLSAGYQINPDMRLNVLGGFPVDIDNKSSINKHKTFYGFTFETGTFLGHWNMNLFYFEQKNDGLTDSNSIGSEVRYRDNTMALFGLFDYDLFYQEINLLQLNANIFLENGGSAFINAHMRKTPLLTTDNALIGRQEQSIEELKKVLNIEQIYQLARDRTADSETVTVGGSRPLNEKFQVSADITFSHSSATPASGGVAAIADSGTSYYVNTLLVGNNLLTKNDTSVLGIRYYDTSTFDTTSFIANTRFPITRTWRINPRLQYDIRTLNDGRSQNKLRAVMRTDYRYLSKARFDLEVGYDQLSDEAASGLLASDNLFFTVGYRWDF